MLCSACTGIFQGNDAPWYHIKQHKGSSRPAYQHHATPIRLLRAANDGCHICSIIWKKLASDEQAALLATWSSPYLHKLTQAVQRLWSNPLAYYSWSPVWFSKEDFGIRFQFGDEPFWKKIVFRLLPLVEDHNDRRRGSKDITSTEPSDDALTRATSANPEHHAHTVSMWTPQVQRLVQGWFKDCTAHHELCQMGDAGHVERGTLHGAFEPTRMVDLSSNRLRLSIDPTERKAARYASLTHRWSLDLTTMPRLNDENVEAWTQDMDPKILTPTFRDAIEVARQMSLRYIWIDSLCIQQTGPGWKEDWQREAALMGEVYRHAFINIQAGRDVETVTYGLFHTPSVRDIDPFKISVSRHLLKPHPHRPAHSDPTPTHLQGTFSIIEEDFARDELLGNPINRRGWVLQERLLSHRIVHFGAQQVFWECRQLLACETFPKGLPRTIPKTMARAATQILKTPTTDFDFTLARAAKPRGTNTSTTRRASLTKNEIPLPSFPSLTVRRDLFAWLYLLDLYSACTLTYPSDKLVAISGLAAIFGSPAFSDRAADVVAYLRSLALPRSGQAVTTFTDDLSDILSAHHTAVSSRAQTDYLAGLWKDELIPCLLWHVSTGRQVDGSPAKRIRGEARAPSWSWASVQGLVNASVYQNWGQGMEGVQLAEVSVARTQLVSDVAPWGAVRGGEVRLSGRVVHERDVRWPNWENVGEGRAVKRHTAEVVCGMVRKIRMNSASVARLRVLRAEVSCYVDDVEEFAGRLRRSGPMFEVALLPLVGLQRRRASWAEALGYVDEIYEWHGLVVKLSGRHQSHDILSRLASSASASEVPGSAVDLDDTQLVGERLGYFRARDVDVFEHVLSKGVDREIVLI